MTSYLYLLIIKGFQVTINILSDIIIWGSYEIIKRQAPNNIMSDNIFIIEVTWNLFLIITTIK